MLNKIPTNIIKYLYRSKSLTRWDHIIKYLQMGLVCSNYSRYYSILFVRGQHYVMTPMGADFLEPQQNRLFSMLGDNKELFLSQGGTEHSEEDAEITVAGENINLNEFYGLNKLWYWIYEGKWLISN